MTEHVRSRQTQARPDRVWEIWSDTSTWSRWNPDVASMEPGRRLELGAETTMRTNAGRSHQMRVVALNPGRSFSLQTNPLPLSTFTFTCSVEPAPGGSTIRQAVQVSGPLGWLVSRTGGERVAQGFEPILDGLVHAAEQR
jgi:uncharacterized protein YndB with AHSA1/START domain